MRRVTVAGGLALAAIAALIAAPVAGATTYNNDTPIIIPEQGMASPYPSTITVSGTAGPITDVNVGLDGFFHSFPDSVSIVLVAPTGQALLLLDCVGGGPDSPAVFLTLDDPPAGQLPDNSPLTTGTFRPTSHCPSTSPFPAPGPLMTYANPGPGAGGGATFASTFNGLSAIGTWELYVHDAAGGSDGSIPGGWSLDVKPDVTPPTSTPGLTCGSGTIQKGSQCVAKKKKRKKKRKKRSR